MALKKTAANKGAGTAIVKWDDKFAKYAKESKEQIANVGDIGMSVRFGRGSISVGDLQVKNNQLDCVVIGHAAVNTFYEGAWDPNERTPPTCFAIASNFGDPEMKPHPNVLHPVNGQCKGCPHNEYGTASTGKGKACANKLRIGLVTAKDVGDDAAQAQLATAMISPTNVRRYKKYLDYVLEEHGRPLWAVVTRIQSFDDPKTQIRLEFSMVEAIDDNETLDALENRYLKIQEMLQQPFQSASDEPKAAPAKKPAVGSRFAGGKRVRR